VPLRVEDVLAAMAAVRWAYRCQPDPGEWRAACPVCGHSSLLVREVERGDPAELICGLGCPASDVEDRLRGFLALHERWHPAPVKVQRRRPIFAATDGLDDLLAADFIPALTGEDLNRWGWTVCPFHDDDKPSLKIYDKPAGHWYCWACSRGGSIIDFGALLYGVTPRGAGFFEIRHRLADDLGVRRAA